MVYGVGVGDNFDQDGLNQLVQLVNDTCRAMTLAEWKQYLRTIRYFNTG
jgi:hypothetical protein